MCVCVCVCIYVCVCVCMCVDMCVYVCVTSYGLRLMLGKISGLGPRCLGKLVAWGLGAWEN